MNVLFLSFKDIVADYNRIMHVDSARVKEYYCLFHDHYENVDHYCVDKNGLLDYKLKINVLDVDRYDFVFIFHEVTMQRLLENYEKKDLLDFIFRKPVFIQLDCSIWKFTSDKGFMSLFKAVGIAHPYSFNMLEHGNKFLIPNATVKREFFVDSNKYGNVVYVGRIKNKTDKLVHFSNFFKTNIDLYTFDEDKEDAERLNGERYIHYMGSLEYDVLGKALWNCSYGLCFFENQSPCGKIFDYISYGLPVLADKRIGENELIVNDGLGLLFDYDNLGGLQFPGDYFDNAHIFNTVQEKHLWKHRLEVWFEIIDNYFKF